MRKVLLAAVTLAASCGGVLAQERFGVVTHVAAGDRLTLKTHDRTLDVVLAQIDAPHAGEPLAAASRESLEDICYGAAATLIETGTALDGATIGKVSCAGVRADEEQVRRGMARVRPTFLELNSILREAQQRAQVASLGIWRQR
jgi:endonuclease YncB( thermonuclease family)